MNKLGDKVLALDEGKYRPAVIVKAADYTSRHGITKGWYIEWTDLPPRNFRDPRPSSGGWKPDSYLKEIVVEDKGDYTAEGGRAESAMHGRI